MAAAVDHDWKKGSAELLILSLLEDQPRHGYEIGKLIDLNYFAQFERKFKRTISVFLVHEGRFLLKCDVHRLFG